MTKPLGDVFSDSFEELWETVSGSMWNIFLKWIYNAIYSAIADFFTVMGNMGAGIFDLSWVEATLKLFSLFGWSLFIAGLAVALFDIAIEYQSMGRFNIKQQLMPIIYGFLAVNLFTVVPVRLYTLCITLQNTFMKDLAKLFSKDIVVSDGFGGQALAALNVINGNVSVFTLLFVIALGYCVIKIFFANIKRGGILLTQIAVGSLYMFSIPKGYTDGFISWMKQVIALCLTAFMQMTLLFLGLLTWQGDMLLGLGVMLAANEVPRIAQNFGLDSGSPDSDPNMISGKLNTESKHTSEPIISKDVWNKVQDSRKIKSTVLYTRESNHPGAEESLEKQQERLKTLCQRKDICYSIPRKRLPFFVEKQW